MSKTLKDSKPEVEKRKGRRPRRMEGNPEKGGKRNILRDLDEEEEFMREIGQEWD